METVRAKGIWQVTAGVIPGDPLKRYEKALVYTSSDMQKDIVTCARNAEIERDADNEKELAEIEDTIFMKRRDEALDHARDVMDPQRVNWVRVDFIWY